MTEHSRLEMEDDVPFRHRLRLVFQKRQKVGFPVDLLIQALTDYRHKPEPTATTDKEPSK